jgi:hypothetical protein
MTVPPYTGQSQSQVIVVPRSIVFKSYQYSPEESCWVMLPYSQIFGYDSQAEASGAVFLPPPVHKTDIFSAQQTWPL